MENLIAAVEAFITATEKKTELGPLAQAMKNALASAKTDLQTLKAALAKTE